MPGFYWCLMSQGVWCFSWSSDGQRRTAVLEVFDAARDQSYTHYSIHARWSWSPRRKAKYRTLDSARFRYVSEEDFWVFVVAESLHPEKAEGDLLHCLILIAAKFRWEESYIFPLPRVRLSSSKLFYYFLISNISVRFYFSSGNLFFYFLVVVKTSRRVRTDFVTQQQKPMMSMAKVLSRHHHSITIYFVKRSLRSTPLTALHLLWFQLNWKTIQFCRLCRIIRADGRAMKACTLEQGLLLM